MRFLGLSNAGMSFSLRSGISGVASIQGIWTGLDFQGLQFSNGVYKAMTRVASA